MALFERSARSAYDLIIVGAKHLGDKFCKLLKIFVPNANAYGTLRERPVSAQDLDIGYLWGRAKHSESYILVQFHKLSPECFAPTKFLSNTKFHI
ncbi:MAG: hypothetical protein WBV73_01995 [Phormidium sp.]